MTSPTRIGRCSATAVPTTPWPTLKPESLDDLLRIADGVGDAQLAAPLVEQIDREHRERRQPRDELRDLLEQLVEVEDGRDFAAQLEERRQQLGVGAAGLSASDGRIRMEPMASSLSRGFRRTERVARHPIVNARQPILLMVILARCRGPRADRTRAPWSCRDP